jgi:hypothetical protein
MSSRGGKHRHGALKQGPHGMIHGLFPLLETVASWPEVTSVIPARIRHAPGGGAVRLRAGPDTPDGLKLTARGRGNVQEVFIVTSAPGKVREHLKEDMA